MNQTSDNSSDATPVASSDAPSLARRLKLIIWKEHQRLIAPIVLVCFCAMLIYFWHQSVVTSGFIDIDRAKSTPAEFQVDINVADWPEIVVLPGVGEKLARAIVDYRTTAGPFRDLGSIQDVPGIGEKKLELLKPFISPISHDQIPSSPTPKVGNNE